MLYMCVCATGADNEKAIESWSFSVNSKGNNPKIILTVRLSPGIAVPLHTLVTAIGKAKDGMLTCRSEALQDKFALPMEAEALATERFGQKSVTVFATIEEYKSNDE